MSATLWLSKRFPLRTALKISKCEVRKLDDIEIFPRMDHAEMPHVGHISGEAGACTVRRKERDGKTGQMRGRAQDLNFRI